MPGRKFNFNTSSELKNYLSDPFDEWKRQHGGDLSELAHRCGVSNAYLAHVRRYGRIPSQPVTILLALNLKLDGQKLFDLAGFSERFPFEPGLQIARPSGADQGFFNFRFDMDGFGNTIRSIVRSELRQRSIRDVLGARPLRIGVNYHMFWMMGSRTPPISGKHTGPFVEIAEMLALALQKEVELINVPFSKYIDALSSGQIDMFGPTMIVPNLPEHILFSRPLFRLGASAVFRKREHPDLPKLPDPTLEDLSDERYQIAVLKNSFLHLIANTRLKRSDATLVLCSSDEEAIERVTMRGVSRPAHVFLTNSMTALITARAHARDLSVHFVTRNSLIDLVEVGVAIRPDWPEIPVVINDAIRFLSERGVIAERLAKVYTDDFAKVVEYN